MAINTAAQMSSPLLSGSDHFIESLSNAAHIKAPYDHWLLEDALPEAMIDAVLDLPFAPPACANYGDGTREALNATRVHFTPKERVAYAVCRDMVDVFSDSSVISALEKATQTDLSKGLLRIEYCQDTDGYWLAPHPDLSVKLFTMLIYVSDDPKLAHAGTDLYDAAQDNKHVGAAPYGKGKGLIFIPGSNTMHGFEKRPMNGIRKSLIVNYVTSEWRSTHELAFHKE